MEAPPKRCLSHCLQSGREKGARGGAIELREAFYNKGKQRQIPSRRLDTMAPGADHHQPNDHALEKFQANFWAKQISVAEAERPDAKHAILPLARIKKVMKSDPDVKVCICPSSSAA